MFSQACHHFQKVVYLIFYPLTGLTREDSKYDTISSPLNTCIPLISLSFDREQYYVGTMCIEYWEDFCNFFWVLKFFAVKGVNNSVKLGCCEELMKLMLFHYDDWCLLEFLVPSGERNTTGAGWLYYFTSSGMHRLSYYISCMMTLEILHITFLLSF